MGCFLACFGGDNDQTQRKRSRKSLPRAKENYKPLQSSRSPSPKKFTTEVTNVSIPQLRENQEQGSTGGGCRKKVTFDLNVVIHEESQLQLEEEEEGKESAKEEENEGKSTAITGANYPANHRYQNSAGSDDSDGSEYGDDEDDDSNFDEEDDNALIVGTEEESYDSFFSLPLESEKQNICQEVSSPIPVSVAAKRHPRDRSQYVHSVLNPVQNLSEWTEVKGRNPNKENVNSEKGNKMFAFEPELVKKFDKENIKAEQESKMIVDVFDRYQTPSFSANEEISVDASLSTWLVSSENSTKGKKGPQESSNSPRSNSLVSREERPILGALTVDDIKRSSVTSSPRRSPSRSPDDIPIVGTVGSYWNHKAHSAGSKKF